MGDLQPAVCPKCKIGFAPDTVVCPICKVELTSGDEPSAAPAPVVLQDDLSSLEELRTAAADWIGHLEDKLAQARIPYRTVLVDPVYKQLSVYVRPDDLPKAKDIDHEVFTLEVPGTEGIPRPEAIDFSTCPGCGSRLGERDQVCSECGLALFPSEGWTCRNCNGPVEVNVEVCPHCGARIDWEKA